PRLVYAALTRSERRPAGRRKQRRDEPGSRAAHVLARSRRDSLRGAADRGGGGPAALVPVVREGVSYPPMAGGVDILGYGLAALVCCVAALLGARMALRAPLLGALLLGTAAVGMFALVSKFEAVAAPLGVNERARDYLGLIARLAIFAVIPWIVGLPMAVLG